MQDRSHNDLLAQCEKVLAAGEERLETSRLILGLDPTEWDQVLAGADLEDVKSLRD